MERRKLKNLTFSLLLVPLLFTAGCSRDGADVEERSTETSTESCYRWVAAKDTILLAVNTRDGVAGGRLAYRFYEKDKSNGTFKGTISDDTLFVNYSFFSEGMFSHREVALLRKGDSYALGGGEMSSEGNRSFFTDRRGIRFDTGILLKRVDCGTLNW